MVTVMPAAWRGASTASRSRISPAARRVKVMARQDCGAAPRSAIWPAIRCARVRVLPVPGPAMIISGPSASTAACWSGSRSPAGPRPAAGRCPRAGAGRRGRCRRRPRPGSRSGGGQSVRRRRPGRSRRRASPVAGAGGRAGPGHLEERGGPVELAGTEQPHDAVFAVVSGLPAYLAPAQPRYRLGQQGAARPAEIVYRTSPRMPSSGPSAATSRLDLGADFLALRAGGQDFADDLRQLHKIGESGRARRADSRPAGQQAPPPGAGRRRSAAYRTRGSFRRVPWSAPGSKRTPHFRCPSRWYLPSSG